MILLIIIGFASGIISGMGIGGGTLLIPALVFFQEIGQHQAQGINLVYFIPTAVTALFLHKKSNNIEMNILKPIIICGLFGAAAGATIATKMDSELLRKLFGGFLFIMGITEFFKKDKSNEKQVMNKK